MPFVSTENTRQQANDRRLVNISQFQKKAPERKCLSIGELVRWTLGEIDKQGFGWKESSCPLGEDSTQQLRGRNNKSAKRSCHHICVSPMVIWGKGALFGRSVSDVIKLDGRWRPSNEVINNRRHIFPFLWILFSATLHMKHQNV